VATGQPGNFAVTDRIARYPFPTPSRSLRRAGRHPACSRGSRYGGEMSISRGMNPEAHRSTSCACASESGFEVRLRIRIANYVPLQRFGGKVGGQPSRRHPKDRAAVRIAGSILSRIETSQPAVQLRIDIDGGGRTEISEKRITAMGSLTLRLARCRAALFAALPDSAIAGAREDFFRRSNGLVDSSLVLACLARGSERPPSSDHVVAKHQPLASEFGRPCASDADHRLKVG